MRNEPLSLRRRHLMLAALATAAASASVVAAPLLAPSYRAAANDVEGKMVLSGRVLDKNGKPLPGATVELASVRVNRFMPMDVRLSGLTVTDADGRFMLQTAAATLTERATHINYRVSHPEHASFSARLNLTHGADADAARLQRDADGVWRTTFGVTLA